MVKSRGNYLYPDVAFIDRGKECCLGAVSLILWYELLSMLKTLLRSSRNVSVLSDMTSKILVDFAKD